MTLSTPRGRRLPPTATSAFDDIRTELQVPQAFPTAVLADARACIERGALHDRQRLELPFVTIDPPESLDLDQALHIKATAGGFVVHYAIADVATFVAPGAAMDNEAWARGVTLYSPDLRTPLYPPVLSEDGASLLPDRDRPALVWALTLDKGGEVSTVEFSRRTVRSVAKLHYAGVQADFDNAVPHTSIAALAELGPILIDQARERGAIELPLPDQQVVPAGDGSWQLTFRSQLPVERWNAQISLLTGRTAAAMMLSAGIGLLRTLPPPDEPTLARLRRVAATLGIEWRQGDSPGEMLSTVVGGSPREAALIDEAAALLRNSGYTAFDGPAPDQPLHAGVASPYAHVTAPLRRLADRYANEVCLAVHGGRDVEDWARTRLAQLPDAMASATRRENELERACLDATEVAVLADRVGEVFEGVVVEAGEDRDAPRGSSNATLVLAEVAVRAKLSAPGLELGTTVRVKVVEVDPAARTIRLALST